MEDLSSLPIELQEFIQICQKKDTNFSLENFEYSCEGLVFIDSELGTLKIDILNDKVNYKRQGHRGKQEIIAKAVGLSKGNKTVFDATFGLGQDALFLQELGAEISGCERHPIIWLLMKEALQRANKSVQLFLEDSLTYLKNISSTASKPDVVYLDPPYNERQYSANYHVLETIAKYDNPEIR